MCYVERDGCWLMMHRIKKNEDENAGKWVGIGVVLLAVLIAYVREKKKR